MYESNLEQVRVLFAELEQRRSVELPFEDRFQVIQLQYRVEDLLAGRQSEPGDFTYCFFANPRGIRYVRLSSHLTQLAHKIKKQDPLDLNEKADAILLLRRLAV